ncbi:hypothetical protein CVT26_012443 [Gymnopilus dilepis]|uniref:Uncharacterized protein n=1 Tax=Gymnopilus dilepis TaxID=231916 RepID=A0A409YWE1_9AGAR|nr:hypothetical protein CVT26_012443 [Gymnopilus dilepis]
MSRRTSLPLTSNSIFRDESLVELGEQMLKCILDLLPCHEFVRAGFRVEREKWSDYTARELEELSNAKDERDMYTYFVRVFFSLNLSKYL